MRVLIIADDLTGALDSAVALTGAGLRCVVARRPADVPAALRERPDVLSVSTASREGGASAARAAVAAALDAVGALPADRCQEGGFPPQRPRRGRGRRPRRARRAQARARRPGDSGAGQGRRGWPAVRHGGGEPDRCGGGGRSERPRPRGAGHRIRRGFRRRAGGSRWWAADAAGWRCRSDRRARSPAVSRRLLRPGAATAFADPAGDRLARPDHHRPGRSSGGVGTC